QKEHTGNGDHQKSFQHAGRLRRRRKAKSAHKLKREISLGLAPVTSFGYPALNRADDFASAALLYKRSVRAARSNGRFSLLTLHYFDRRTHNLSFVTFYDLAT